MKFSKRIREGGQCHSPFTYVPFDLKIIYNLVPDFIHWLLKRITIYRIAFCHFQERIEICGADDLFEVGQVLFEIGIELIVVGLDYFCSGLIGLILPRADLHCFSELLAELSFLEVSIGKDDIDSLRDRLFPALGSGIEREALI